MKKQTRIFHDIAEIRKHYLRDLPALSWADVLRSARTPTQRDLAMSANEVTEEVDGETKEGVRQR